MLEKENAVKLAIDEFNRYRSPEATAVLISFTNDIFVVRFVGPFSSTCGFYDYFEDFKHFLREFGVEAAIKGIEEMDGGSIVKFRI